ELDRASARGRPVALQLAGAEARERGLDLARVGGADQRPLGRVRRVMRGLGDVDEDAIEAAGAVAADLAGDLDPVVAQLAQVEPAKLALAHLDQRPVRSIFAGRGELQ